MQPKDKAIVADMKEKKELPPNLNIVITGDQSVQPKPLLTTW
jgi:hypothetical protein